MSARDANKALPLSLILLALVIAACFALWAKANTWHYTQVRGMYVRSNQWNGETQQFTSKGWRKVGR